MKIPDYAADIPERTIRGIRDHIRRREAQRRRRQREELEAFEREAIERGRRLEDSGWICADY